MKLRKILYDIMSHCVWISAWDVTCVLVNTIYGSSGKTRAAEESMDQTFLTIFIFVLLYENGALHVEVCFYPQFEVSRGLMNAGLYESTANYKGSS